MIKRLLSSQLRINMVSGTATTILNMVVLAVAYPVYLHFLGYEQYGLWLVLSTVLGFAQLGNLGVGHAVTKLVAEEYGRGDLEAAEQYVTCALAILLASGAAVFVLIVVLNERIVAVFKLSEGDGRIVSWLLPYMACLSIAVFIGQALNATLSGLGRMDLANYVQTGGRGITLVTATVLLCLGEGIKSLLVANLLSYVFICTMSVILVRRILRVRICRLSNLRLGRFRRLFTFGAGVLGSSLISMLLSPFNKLMLSRYVGVTSIPVYEIAYQGSMQVRAVAEAGIRALMPEVSRLGANLTHQARVRIRGINKRAVQMIICFGLPLYGVLICAAPLVLRGWLGGQVAGSLPLAFRIALFSSLLSLACVPAYYLLLGLGHVRHCLLGHLILSGVNVVLVLAWAWTGERLSVPVVLVATLVGTLVSSVYLIFQNHRKLALQQHGTRDQEQPKEARICLHSTSAHA